MQGVGARRLAGEDALVAGPGLVASASSLMLDAGVELPLAGERQGAARPLALRVEGGCPLVATDCRGEALPLQFDVAQMQMEVRDAGSEGDCPLQAGSGSIERALAGQRHAEQMPGVLVAGSRERGLFGDRLCAGEVSGVETGLAVQKTPQPLVLGLGRCCGSLHGVRGKRAGCFHGHGLGLWCMDIRLGAAASG